MIWRLIALGWPVIEPVCRDMLRRIKDHDSPVARGILPLLRGPRRACGGCGKGMPASPPDTPISNTDSSHRSSRAGRGKPWRSWYPHCRRWSRAPICSKPICFASRSLDRHHLCERQWLKQWLDFKRARRAVLRSGYPAREAIELKKRTVPLRGSMGTFRAAGEFPNQPRPAARRGRRCAPCAGPRRSSGRRA